MTVPAAALLAIAAGIALAAWGLAAAHRLPRRGAALAALAFPVGIALFLAGTLLLAVPGFLGGR
jgi:hypothetical protein